MKVLIVDDEPLARNELHYLLKENVLINEIDEANGVMMADQKVNANQPDLVFLDIKLDDGNRRWLDVGKSCRNRQQSFLQPPMTIMRSMPLMRLPLTIFSSRLTPSASTRPLPGLPRFEEPPTKQKMLLNRQPGKIQDRRSRLMTKQW